MADHRVFDRRRNVAAPLFSGQRAKGPRIMRKHISPHPNPLPKGEGVAAAFLLPWGEGQDEGRCRNRMDSTPTRQPVAPRHIFLGR
jgi:hypothetical protein